ncbi:hypothetical protein LJ737_15690 [Hymenobacter sp. 15J16-1T3B]|uniref:hypothetical protein n=1 Tax=Hymenobacter sp. 15J16-1T3B TaxID=2886941 RepID=UPI001D1218D9|nr:hypothetical protein [Hymenobacter sp. 15J16-1T3B]MCC3158689.1 hypothetical protein [Hymenobacter sp. 15J16-1T3B]
MRFLLLGLLLWLPCTSTLQAQTNSAAPLAHHRVDAPTRQAEDSAVVQAGRRYAGGKVHGWVLGRNYRQVWEQPVRVPVLDLSREAGGLVPVKLGGGMQTKSLRLQAADGRQFVLRSVDKNTEQVLAADLRGTVAARVVQDQISAEHPYAALVVPPLAEAAGVGHTAPRLVLVPDDERLGEFRTAFGGTLAYLETREPAPPPAFAGVPRPRSLSTDKVLDLLAQSAANRVDERQVLRARLFDLFLADWDRHDEQWRWWAYPQPDGGVLLRPVPLDRDQAFFVNQGVVPRLASREWALPKFQGFDDELRDVNTFSYNARYFDRSFLAGLEEDVWQAEAASLQAALTDEVIEQAVRQLPAPIYRLSAARISRALRQHRAALPRYAQRYYRFLARQVNVVGSNEPERFDVTQVGDNRTRVRVTPLVHGQLATRPSYERTFDVRETHELDLYARGGADQVVVSGTVPAGLRLRVIGGHGADTITDQTNAGRGSRRLNIYDTRAGNDLRLGAATRNRTQSDTAVNRYDRRTYRYPYTGPLLPWAYNMDDGLFVGLGLNLRRAGFRKDPWAAEHVLTGNVALGTGAFTFRYAGRFTHLVGRTDLLLNADVQAPNYVRNFFGLGNETAYDPARSIRYYRVRFRNLAVEALARRQLGLRHELRAGPVYQAVRVENTPGRFISLWQAESSTGDQLFRNRQYGGLRMSYAYDSRLPRVVPVSGFTWRLDYLLLHRLDARARPLSQLSTTLAGYLLPLPRLTLATRVGGTANMGSYAFFQAATLGGIENLRGYRRTRFAGDHSLYHNAEARWRLATVHSLLLNGEIGLLAFHDLGRVWLRGESSQQWHRGYGGGLWFRPLDRLVLTAMYGFSEEDQLPLVRLGFFF